MPPPPVWPHLEALVKVPSPQELGLPAKFDSWRPGQIEALRMLMTSNKRIKAIGAPPGFGKSAVIVGFALWTQQPTCIVTDSRSLQDQYMEDFREIGMVDIRGRRNYECGLRPDYTCEEGYQAGCPMRGTTSCSSSRAEMRAAISPLVVTNYDKWCSAKKFGTGMSHFKQVMYDEGHETHNAVSRSMQVTIGHRERDKDICLDPPVNVEDMATWREWAVEARALIEPEYKRALDVLRNNAHALPAQVRYALHMRHLHRRLNVLVAANPKNWIVEELEKAFQFDVIRPGRYTESALFFRVPSVVIVSATLHRKTLFMLGQSADSFDFREFPSDFDPKDSPIYYLPTMRVDKRAASLGMLWLRLDQVAAARRDRKGIVHTISYSRRDEILTQSRYAASMFVNEKGEAPTEMIHLFKDATDGSILVSPSVGQGHDFPGPACEWQILVKIPFPPPSAIQTARTKDDPEYPYYQAVQKMVQIFGRATRYRGDRCENFIFDEHFGWFMRKHGHLAPKSFHGFVKTVDRLPQPPARIAR
jgi:ATP-dependent DNA helicase DinG